MRGTDGGGVMEDQNLPPHNIDAEQAFLGALLYDNELAHQTPFLKAEHFYDPVHGRLFDEAMSRIHGGTLANEIALRTWAENDPGLAEIGGVTYLAILQESAAYSKAAVEYARIVFRLSRMRDLKQVAEGLAHEAGISSAEDVDKLIEGAEAELFRLGEEGTTSRGFVAFKDHANEAYELAHRAHETGGTSGLSTGIKGLDEKLGGLHKSDLIILAGRPSMGKTGLALTICDNLADAGKPVGFVSLEMAGAQLAGRSISRRSGVPGWKIREGKASKEEFGLYGAAAREIAARPLFIDDTGGIPIGTLCARARRLKIMHDVQLLVVDYLQLVTSSRRGEGRVNEVSEITQALKALAKELNIPVIALSQLSRAVEQRDDKKPQLSDLRESGSIEQDADVVMFCYRAEYYHERLEPQEGTKEHLAWEDELDDLKGKAEVIIGKQRHGPIGTAKLAFDGNTTSFSDREQ